MCQDVLFQMCKLTLDSIEPRGVRGCKLESDIVVFDILHYRSRFVRRQIIQHNPDSPRIPTAHGFEKSQKVTGPFALCEMAPQFSGPDLVSAVEVAHAVPPTVRGAKSFRFSFALPRSSGVGPQFQRSELVDADYRFASLFRRLVERLRAVFFSSNCGSSDSFHVLLRWSVT